VLKNIKTRAVWMAIGIVLGGGALSYAGVAATASHSPNPHANPKASIHASAEPTESESPEPSKSTDHPLNHGFYVSQAAACQNVNDTVNHITFTAPADCATNGQAHGQYVSSVARSDAGKGPHGNGHANSKP